MYTITHNTELSCLEINSPNNSLQAKIVLNEGASLQELKLNNHKIINNLDPLTYSDTYASSLLFPFANRIKDGTYNFDGKTYKLYKNQEQEGNALHGLIYNKSFKVLDQKTTNTSATVQLEYIETNLTEGFPFTYSIKVTYTFSENNVELSVSAKNTSKTPFPFTLGWHPYFTSDDLYNSSISFDSNKKLDIGERNITKGITNIDLIDNFEIQDKQLDDCWILNSDEVVFKTPKYNLQFNATAKNNFLQAYTPDKKNTIAIEPTTGVSDSFNNQIGLQTLKPNETYSITWTLKID